MCLAPFGDFVADTLCPIEITIHNEKRQRDHTEYHILSNESHYLYV